MGWQVTTVTGANSGSSSMGANTALDRLLFSLPGSARLTSLSARFCLKLGGNATTYNAFGTNELTIAAPWIYGVSFVPTGGTVPNLDTAPDDPQFLMVDWSMTDDIRQTINQANSPEWNDLYGWVGHRYGHFQLDTTVGGSVYMHISNSTTTLYFTGWSVFVRATYALIN